METEKGKGNMSRPIVQREKRRRRRGRWRGKRKSYCLEYRLYHRGSNRESIEETKRFSALVFRNVFTWHRT